MRLVLVEWLDAFSTDKWTKINRLTLAPDRTKSLCKTVGWLVHDGADFKVVVSTTGHKDGSGTMTIPSGCVQRIQNLHIDHAEVGPESER